MKKIPKKYTSIAMAVIMSLIMSGVISLAFLMLGGQGIGAIRLWPSSWLKAWAVALPVAVIVMPLVRRIVQAITE